MQEQSESTDIPRDARACCALHDGKSCPPPTWEFMGKGAPCHGRRGGSPPNFPLYAFAFSSFSLLRSRNSPPSRTSSTPTLGEIFGSFVAFLRSPADSAMWKRNMAKYMDSQIG